jgi:ketosteroid isomerase-like protein
MRPIVSLLALLTAVLLLPLNAAEQATPATAEDPAHAELRQLRDGLLAVMNKGELEGTLAFMHSNIVVTWHNAEVSRGHDGVRAYYAKVMTGPSKLVESFTCDLKVDELTILYGGDTGICFGSSDEQFRLVGGQSLNVKGRWSATLVKENGRWLVANLHASTNLFDNVLLSMSKRTGWVAAGICLVLGGLLGWMIFKPRKATA